MIRTATIFSLMPGAALAHPGHWADLAGHDHWIALGALGLAGLIGLAAIAKGRREDAEAPEDDKAAEQEA